MFSKNIKKYPLPFTILLLIIILIFLFLGNVYFKKEKIASNKKIYSLKKDGFCIFHQVLNPTEIQLLKEKSNQNQHGMIKKYLLNHQRMNELVKISTNKNYQFQDYIWIMKKSSVHTCHRDNNGSFFNKNQKYPSYTMIIYLEDMDKCLGVLPGSQINKNSYFVNFTDQVTDILCKSGDVIIFNANLIHVGTINTKDDNLRIQLKVSHKEDIPYLSYYENYNKVLDKENKVPKYLRKIQKDISCTFPGLSDLSQYEMINTTRGTEDGAKIGILQRIFSFLFYGDSNYHDISNIKNM